MDVETFLNKIRNPEGCWILIENFYTGCMEAHIYRVRDMVIYVSPRIYNKPPLEGTAFVTEVESISETSSALLKRWQW